MRGAGSRKLDARHADQAAWHNQRRASSASRQARTVGENTIAMWPIPCQDGLVRVGEAAGVGRVDDLVIEAPEARDRDRRRGLGVQASQPFAVRLHLARVSAKAEPGDPRAVVWRGERHQSSDMGRAVAAKIGAGRQGRPCCASPARPASAPVSRQQRLDALAELRGKAVNAGERRLEVDRRHRDAGARARRRRSHHHKPRLQRYP